MSGLLFLSSEDFRVEQGANGNILCNQINGFSLILFYSTKCVHCHTLTPIFKGLPGSVGGCQFGMINVSFNKRCVQMSQQTITPITYVPYIILYIQGKPFMKYNGPYEAKEIRRFIVEVAEKIQTKQQFESQNVKHNGKKNRIPEYTIGKPLYGCRDDVCYLEFEEAYKSNT